MISSSRMCLASNVNTHQLRSQLDQLHKEASETASKANNARLRLLRLSEAAESLRQQAAKSLQVGKDDEARELLLQKKKILRAMEKSKSRAHLLDELAAKLTEAISVKETNLIGKVASGLEFGGEELNSGVHVVSPKQDIVEIGDGNDKSRQGNVVVCEDSDPQFDCGIEGEIGAEEKSHDFVASDKAISVKETHLIGKVASGLEFGGEELNSGVHVVSPKQGIAEIVDGNDESRQGNVVVCEDSDPQLDSGIEGEIGAEEESCDFVASDKASQWIESEIPSGLNGISSYSHFLEHLDSQFSRIETDLTSYLRLISLVLEDKEMATNMKCRQVKEILHKVLDSRSSIRNFLRSE